MSTPLTNANDKSFSTTALLFKSCCIYTFIGSIKRHIADPTSESFELNALEIREMQCSFLETKLQHSPWILEKEVFFHASSALNVTFLSK